MHRTAFLLLLPALLPAISDEVTGDYVEGRSNHVFGCYCEWSFESAVGGTEAILAWSFRSGSYGEMPVAGAAVIAVIVGDSTLSSGQPPRKTVLFIDPERAGEERALAAAGLIRTRFADLLGNVLAVRSAPVELTLESDAASVRAGDFVRVLLRKARLPQDAMQGARLWYDPFVPLEEATIAATLRMRYTGPEFRKRWELNDAGTTGYYGRFRWPAR